jgi:hypothetical protein
VITFVVKATSHLATWLIWQATGVSLLDDLDAPERPN